MIMCGMTPTVGLKTWTAVCQFLIGESGQAPKRWQAMLVVQAAHQLSPASVPWLQQAPGSHASCSMEDCQAFEDEGPRGTWRHHPAHLFAQEYSVPSVLLVYPACQPETWQIDFLAKGAASGLLQLQAALLAPACEQALLPHLQH